jgi:hypothetical protein
MDELGVPSGEKNLLPHSWSKSSGLQGQGTLSPLTI